MISRPQIVYFKTFEDLYKSPYDLALWNTSLEHVLIQVFIFSSVIKFQNVTESNGTNMYLCRQHPLIPGRANFTVK